jgi:hypothetical protein
MTNAFAEDEDFTRSLRDRLSDHPIYTAVATPKDLRVFMQHHVYSVWDFMSLIKFLQHHVAPCRWPWTPPQNTEASRFINELVMEEESDEDAGGNGFSSHFELYLGAMEEIGAETQPVRRFVQTAGAQGTEAALALGREHVIPAMFRALLAKIGVSEADAPIFHYYLNRHIGLDEDFHGPMSLRLLDHFCAGDANRVEEAREAARTAVAARLAFWDGVNGAIHI